VCPLVRCSVCWSACAPTDIPTAGMHARSVDVSATEDHLSLLGVLLQTYVYIYIYIPLVASFLAHPVVLSSTGLVELLGPLGPLGPLSSLGPFGPLGPLGPFGFPRMSCCVFTIRHVFSCASGGAIGGGPSAPCAWGRAHCALEPVGPFGPLGPTAHWSAEFP